MQKSFTDLFIAHLVTIYFLLTAAMRGGAWERGLHRPGAEGWEISQRRRLQIITDLAHHTLISANTRHQPNISLMGHCFDLLFLQLILLLRPLILSQLDLNNGLESSTVLQIIVCNPN